MSSEKKRSENFSQIEKQFIIDFIKEHPIIEKKEASVNILKQKNECWKELCRGVNAEFERMRSVDQLKVLWKRMKVETKKAVANNKREAYKTGGGVNEARELTADEEEVAAIIATELEPLPNAYDGDRSRNDLETESPKEEQRCSKPKYPKKEVDMRQFYSLEERKVSALERIATVSFEIHYIFNKLICLFMSVKCTYVYICNMFVSLFSVVIIRMFA